MACLPSHRTGIVEKAKELALGSLEEKQRTIGQVSWNVVSSALPAAGCLPTLRGTLLAKLVLGGRVDRLHLTCRP
jgi:hypothetical protein